MKTPYRGQFVLTGISLFVVGILLWAGTLADRRTDLGITTMFNWVYYALIAINLAVVGRYALRSANPKGFYPEEQRCIYIGMGTLLLLLLPQLF